MAASDGFGNMDFFHFGGNGFDIWYSDYALSQDAKFVSRGDFPVLELQIPFNSHFVSWWDGKEEMLLKDKLFDLSYYPFVESKASFTGGYEYSSFDIY